MDDECIEIKSSNERVVQLINQASLARSSKEKMECLSKTQELLLHHNPDLLDNFLDEVMAFQKDTSQDVRKFVVGFIEEACKKDPDLLSKVIANLQYMMTDQSVVIQKRVIQAMTHVYKLALAWISGAKCVTTEMEAVWNVICGIKYIITSLLDSHNDGIRTYTVKFMEMLVITQTHVAPTDMSKKSNEFSLDSVPLTLKIARPRKLEEEAREVLDKIITYHCSPHISSANLMTCMGSLTNIAKSRWQFFSKVITAFEMLHANLPPTLARSQVSSVRKNLKNQLLSLLKHPLAADNFFSNITTLLSDLGATKEEITRAIPQFEELRRRARKVARPDGDIPIKIRKTEDAQEEDDDEDDLEEEKSLTSVKDLSTSAVDITDNFIQSRLSSKLATELILMFMTRLPRTIPPQFYNTYTPIAAAGTDLQIKHVSRLLATQFTSAGVGPGVNRMARERARNARKSLDAEVVETKPSEKISTLISGSCDQVPLLKEEKTMLLQPVGLGKKLSFRRSLKLAEITKHLSVSENKRLLIDAMIRILKAEKAAKQGGGSQVRVKAIVSLICHFPSNSKFVLLNFIFEDFSARINLAMSWLYEEYCHYQGFSIASNLWLINDETQYNFIMCELIKGVIKCVSSVSEKQKLLNVIYLQAPHITDDAITLLKQFVLEEGNAMHGVCLMNDLVMKRPTRQLNFLNSLLEFCSHSIAGVRNIANETIVVLYKNNSNLKNIIEEYSLMYLRCLPLSNPPAFLFSEDRGRPIVETQWSEDIIKVCLYLYLNLLPINRAMLHHLTDVYVSTTISEVKRTILRVLDTPFRKIPMECSYFLDLVEKCPTGSETLITRIIHIMTDKTNPSPQLVEKVLCLYKNRINDVRFLIPVLSGLKKADALCALPKLIQLNPIVVKEVFNRLIGIDVVAEIRGPLSPSDLLVSLHLIDTSECDMKTIIKATSLCFAEKDIYTKEVVAIVLQQLMDEYEIPVLLMRTVIQAVSFYPSLIGFIMGLLRRLINRHIWNQKRLWSGFIKCCERTVPQSYAVLLSLPPAQLSDLLKNAENLRDPLLQHVQSFTETQRTHVTPAIMNVLYGIESTENADDVKKTD